MSHVILCTSSSCCVGPSLVLTASSVSYIFGALHAACLCTSKYPAAAAHSNSRNNVACRTIKVQVTVDRGVAGHEQQVPSFRQGSPRSTAAHTGPRVRPSVPYRSRCCVRKSEQAGEPDAKFTQLLAGADLSEANSSANHLFASRALNLHCMLQYAREGPAYQRSGAAHQDGAALAAATCNMSAQLPRKQGFARPTAANQGTSIAPSTTAETSAHAVSCCTRSKDAQG
jgi:hypothetical protein